MIAGHGDDRYNYEKIIQADFSSNVWFGETSPGLISHLQKNINLIERYPEPDAAGLCREIASFHEVNHNQILAFNGSVEAFYTIALAFRESGSAILYPGFTEYEDACLMHNHQLSFFRKDEWQSCMDDNPALIWFGNPNNPDGHIFEFLNLKLSIEYYPDTVFIVDEAYAGLTHGFQSVIPLIRTNQNLIVVRSLTKSCVIPGLRLGYLVTSLKLAAKLKRFQQPWSVNTLAQEAGKFILGSGTETPSDTKKLNILSSNLQKAINQISGFRVVPSPAPFFLIEMQSGTVAELKQFLYDEMSILIRDASNFRGLDKHFFRVSTRSESDNQLLLRGLTEWKTKIDKKA